MKKQWIKKKGNGESKLLTDESSVTVEVANSALTIHAATSSSRARASRLVGV